MVYTRQTESQMDLKTSYATKAKLYDGVLPIITGAMTDGEWPEVEVSINTGKPGNDLGTQVVCSTALVEAKQVTEVGVLRGDVTMAAPLGPWGD